jgi:hypothetical protein
VAWLRHGRWRDSYFFLLLDAVFTALGLADVTGLVLVVLASAALGGAVDGALALGISPKVDFTGQTANTGHFRQPTAIAMGQIIMASSFGQS